MHDRSEDDTTKRSAGPYRKGALPRAQRRFAEHCDDGDLLEWPSPPALATRLGEQPGHAPSARGRVTMNLWGSPFIRFEVGGGTVGPLAIQLGQPCSVLHSHRDGR